MSAWEYHDVKTGEWKPWTAAEDVSANLWRCTRIDGTIDYLWRWNKAPARQEKNCSFCDRKNLLNYFTGKTGRIACPDCFQERVEKKLAKKGT
ncbi:MAG: hypothetical protein ACE5HN_08830 [Nitrospiria bacterium]